MIRTVCFEFRFSSCSPVSVVTWLSVELGGIGMVGLMGLLSLSQYEGMNVIQRSAPSVTLRVSTGWSVRQVEETKLVYS